jgi:hypothetical protein
MSEAHLLREVETQQSIGILVSPSFPGVVGMGEVDLELVGSFHLLVVTHLNTIIQRQGLAVTYGDRSEALLRCLFEALCRLVG